MEFPVARGIGKRHAEAFERGGQLRMRIEIDVGARVLEERALHRADGEHRAQVFGEFGALGFDDGDLFAPAFGVQVNPREFETGDGHDALKLQLRDAHEFVALQEFDQTFAQGEHERGVAGGVSVETEVAAPVAQLFRIVPSRPISAGDGGERVAVFGSPPRRSGWRAACRRCADFNVSWLLLGVELRVVRTSTGRGAASNARGRSASFCARAAVAPL